MDSFSFPEYWSRNGLVIVVVGLEKSGAYASGHLASQFGVGHFIAHREQVVARGVEFHGIVPCLNQYTTSLVGAGRAYSGLSYTLSAPPSCAAKPQGRP
jgi:hypothetical protein